MGKILPFAPRPADQCACARCRSAERRFPLDPPQLVLPMTWPGELVLLSVEAGA